MSLAERKTELRRDILKKRDALSSRDRKEFSGQIAQFAPQLNVAESDIVSAFLPIRSEVNLKSVIQYFWQHEISVCLPYMLNETDIEFREYSEETQLVRNGFGTLAPDDSEQILLPDTLLVPLSAFDKLGHRMGYGAGYYDRAIAHLKNLGKARTLIGVAFSVQECDEVPVGPHDVPLDFVLTENGLRSFE